MEDSNRRRASPRMHTGCSTPLRLVLVPRQVVVEFSWLAGELDHLCEYLSDRHSCRRRTSTPSPEPRSPKYFKRPLAVRHPEPRFLHASCPPPSFNPHPLARRRSPYVAALTSPRRLHRSSAQPRGQPTKCQTPTCTPPRRKGEGAHRSPTYKHPFTRVQPTTARNRRSGDGRQVR